MKWDEFIQKLTTSKKMGLSGGLSVPCIANLIYAGAFDGMLESPPIPGEMLSIYNSMFEEVKKSLKSKASLPKKTKTQSLGLSDLQNDLQLGLWRFMVNPMSKFDFLPFCYNKLKMRGFDDLPEHVKRAIPGIEKNYPMKHEGNTEKQDVPAYLVNMWDDVYESRIHQNIPLYFQKNNKNKPPPRYGCMVGVIVNTKKMPFGKDGKKRLIFDFYNGHQLTQGIVVWPDFRTGKLPPWTLLMQKMTFGIVTLMPKMYKGRRTAQAVMWDSFI